MKVSFTFSTMRDCFVLLFFVCANFGFIFVHVLVAALMSMKNKMNDGLHAMNGWDINSVDPCTWNMVGCSSEGYVISL